MNLSDFAILNIKGSDYFCVIKGIEQKWGHKPNAKCLFYQARGIL